MIFDDQHRVMKIAAIVYGIDPLGNVRILMRHNKPYDGKHLDEWTFVWGTIEEDETFEEAAKREATEEFSITSFEECKLLNDTHEFVGQHGKSIAHFCLLKIKDIEVPVTLNEESIGFDWKLIKDALPLVRNNEQEIIVKLE